jgi:hypothetical protein
MNWKVRARSISQPECNGKSLQLLIITIYWYWAYNGNIQMMSNCWLANNEWEVEQKPKQKGTFSFTFSSFTKCRLKLFFNIVIYFFPLSYHSQSVRARNMKHKNSILKSCVNEVTVILSLLALASIVTHVHALDNGLALTPPMGWLSWQR